MNTLVKLLSLVLFLGFISCSSDEECPSDHFDSWTLGAVASGMDVMEDIRTFTSEKGCDMLTIRAVSTSLCPNTGLRVSMSTDDGEFYSGTWEQFGSSTGFPIPTDKEITVRSILYPIENSTVVCVWLGNVDIEISY